MIPASAINEKVHASVDPVSVKVALATFPLQSWSALAVAVSPAMAAVSSHALQTPPTVTNPFGFSVMLPTCPDISNIWP
jgi:hypothetical protein